MIISRSTGTRSPHCSPPFLLDVVRDGDRSELRADRNLKRHHDKRTDKDDVIASSHHGEIRSLLPFTESRQLIDV